MDCFKFEEQGFGSKLCSPVLKSDDGFPLLAAATRLFLARPLARPQCVSVLFYKLSKICLLMGLNMFLDLIFLVSNAISAKVYFQCTGFAIIAESQLMCI